MSATDRQLVEQIEILAGTRPGAAGRAAVRVDDLRELLQLSEIRASEVSAAPTADQHNALVRDVREIKGLLRAVATALQGRILR